MDTAAFLVAAPASGSGKTILTCALLSAFQQRGIKTAACKCGPDYIDPMFHREVLGVESVNLDLYLCGREAMKNLFREHVCGSQAVVAEGVMGYYDGMALDSSQASTYDVARTLGLPVILAVNCRGMSLSVLPLILGIIEFQKDSNIQGILLNRVSHMLYPRMKNLIEDGLKARGYHIPVVGYLPQQEAFSLKSRHLGLVTPGELKNLRSQLSEAGRIVSNTVDLELLLQIGRQAHLGDGRPGPAQEAFQAREGKIRIGIAKDEAFCFYYKDNLRLLEKLGCELVAFSPLGDKKLPGGIRGLLLGGGYPELFAKELESNQTMRRSIQSAVAGGMPCLAECGGFMYLHEEMEGKDGAWHTMAGAIPGRAVRTDKLVRFGYIELHARQKGAFLDLGETIRAHEFHYWDSTDNGSACLAVKPDGRRSYPCMHMEGNLFAGFPHIHFYSHPQFAERFVKCCRGVEGRDVP
ncbi:cobyrinate a,c-diamide synthase [Luxibacter massiliensis]|uniref:cobyrinate a,c-diamide synthase n=1 Tax=Luxibacter massiliensis TaxID=2219695 RepID=UPI000F04A571|nr:cobyrinate a,c-diamide synthase [Luxibacter massiliensis]